MTIEHEDHQDINSELGELPYGTSEERRELYSDEVPAELGPPGIISDMPGSPRPQPPQLPLMPRPRDVRGANAALIDAATAPIGTPTTDFLIQTTFDARPINGNDWTFFNVLALDPNGDVGAPVSSQTLRFTVPDGRVAIIRRFNWESTQILAIPGNPEPSEIGMIELFVPVFVSLAVSGFVQRTYERIFQQEGTRDTYAIGFEKETIDVTITINTDFSGSLVGYQPAFFVEMYGNLLDTRGREKQYEPANEYRGGILK